MSDATRERTILRAGDTGPGVLARTSVSQVGTFDPSQDGGCPTKWWMEKIDGRSTPTTAAMTGGTEDHAQIEHYLNTGEDVLGPRTRVGKYLIPTPGSDLLVEHEFSGTDLVAAGVPFLGYIDCVNPRSEYLDAEGELKKDPWGTIEVIDWKTTSDFKWAKAGSALVRTVQMPAYGQYVSGALFPKWASSPEFVRLSHVYFRTKGAPAAEKRTALVPLTTIRSRWETIEGVVREMKDVALESDVRKVPKNLNACTAYGGCPHANYCPRNKLDLLKTVLHAKHTEATPAQGARPMGILAQLKAEAAAALTPKPTPPSTALPEPTVDVVAPPAVTRVVAAVAAEVRANPGKFPGLSAPPKPPSKLDAIAKMKADLAEAERLAALDLTDPEGGGTPNDDNEADLAERQRLAGRPLAPAPAIVLAKDAIVNTHYEGRMEDGSSFKVQFIDKTKAGWTFRRLDKSGTMNLEEDTGLVYVSGPALAPIPTGVLPHDVPKPGQSGPTFTPFAEGESAPTNVLAEQARLLSVAANVGGKAAPKVLPEVITGIPATGIPAQVPPAPAAEKGTRFRRTKEEIAAGLTVEQAQAARAKAAPAPAKGLYQQLVETPPIVVDADAMKKSREEAVRPVELVKVKPAVEAPPVVDTPVGALKAEENPVLKDEPVKTYAGVPAHTDFVLYLDIVPVKGGENVKSLQPFLDDVCDALGKAHGVGDIRYATGNNDLAFGKWKGALAEALKESVIDPGSWSLVGIRESEIRQVAAEAFSSKATTVFRSVG